MAGRLRGPAVPGGGESSDSDEDGWDIGYTERPDKLKDSLLSEEKDEVLKRALTTGDGSLLEELLNSGMQVDSSFRFGWTPLMYAASIANVDLVRILLDRGANASFSKDQHTVLMAACSARVPEERILKTAELLLSRNASPNATCRKRMSPLMYAAREGHSQLVALLVGHGAEINAQDDNGYTALAWAARHGHKTTVLKLLELGADKTLQTQDGKTPAEIAKRNKHPELFSMLSLTLNPLHGKFQNITKEENICKFLITDSEKSRDHGFSSYSAFGDLEIFLHGLQLEHLTELLKERDITLRQLLTLRKDDFTKIGITNVRDQKKIMDAVEELQVEEIKFEELPEVMKLEFSGDEFLNFLLKLSKQCGHLTTAVQDIISQFPVHSHKIVLEWGSPECFTSVCEDLVHNAQNLGEEVGKLKHLIQKLHNDQKNDSCRIPPMENVSTGKKRLWKRAAVTVCGFGLLFIVCKLTFLRK
ncbi:ankyrin repeat, SAM and basic leucine zipper domain-containing protein 1 isoform X1 [Ornithorhynchus anatinus]|uniref:Ankyrin repeat, SAM and basic leucine zipper domain-containing protein 1 n=2 Tax=Ornithorhynchus anatinus TaxID=9258 RepID=ASZ1_ORNAN|nr:ankyrin repeat, SAM and basic leucine zipper domain-containing protein 1 isoform X1 [Ornithorhynchus anatinus]Q07DZ7.1 RecName: Full=Ankyrin repeat, SAM and basic leucine zipper domain-containing protein 1; AltName: Full=Germ cell-specific ankyrin, SAM and basic leucine zipper domain-containing protein [Ornithorhynchus anatinus]ABI93679.1 GASZ [Ornithorhynchus anatinus]